MGQVRPTIVRVKDDEELAQEVASRFIDAAQKAAKAKGVFRVAISGGHTPTVFYQRLSEKSVWSQIEWDKLHLFWVDERCVPPADEASNYGAAARLFLSDVPIPAENIHRIRGENSDCRQAAAEYERILLNAFRMRPGQVPKFDLMMLGLGADGHIGSLFPNTDHLSNRTNLACPVYQAPDGLNRITLTLPVIQRAEQIIILVSGQAKAEIVRRVFQSAPDEKKYPVQLLWPVRHKVIWVIDRQAAALIR